MSLLVHFFFLRTMKKLCLVTLMTLTGVAVAADTVAPPPAYTGRAELPAVADRAAPAAASDDAARLEPNENDMKRARARARHDEETRHAQPEPYISKRGTKIEERHDQNNRLTEVRVTPGTTEIPYTMKNRGDRPIDNRPGADSHSTLDTPKFIQFGW